MMNKMLNNKNKIFLIIITICVIMNLLIKTFAYGDMEIREVHYSVGGYGDYVFDIFTDCIKFHTKANGYEKYKGMETRNNMNSFMDTDIAKMDGYGNYIFKPQTNLYSFIEYCYSKEPETTIVCAYKAGTSDVNSWDYVKLMSNKDRVVSNEVFKNFWQNMTKFCVNFKNYQDEFFFKNYTYKAIEKVGISLSKLRKLKQENESIKEYLTSLTSYVFSITGEAEVQGMTLGKGDLIPFLYYKDKKHGNIDIDDYEALKEIAKYAYVALIEGWCELPTRYHLWQDEYQYLFGTYNRDKLDYDIETLQKWYEETDRKHYNDKGKKGNNLLGSDIDHIIESDYSIEEQLEATDYYIRQMFEELGIETDYKEIMARNELMAKYMMQKSKIDDVIKDYNVSIKFMTENLQRGTHEEKNTHTVVTSDFQKLEFDYTIDKRYSKHSDEDGINDGEELGNEKWVDITGFVKKAYEDVVRRGDSHKKTFEEQVEDIIDKNGRYIDCNGNIVYGSVKWDETKTKVLYRTYDYKSNPKLKDTDFDGIDDNKETNVGYRLSGSFKGNAGELEEVEYINDFRNFFVDNDKYNDELAVMSLMIANGKYINTNQVNVNDIKKYIEKIGFENVVSKEKFKIDDKEEIRGKMYVGKKTIQYNVYESKNDNKGKKAYKDVYGIFLMDFDNEENFKQLVLNKDKDDIERYYDKISQDIEENVERYRKMYPSKENRYCFWITGYSIAGGVASHVSPYIIANGEVYTYTFGAVNTTKGGSTGNQNIKNIINEDDLIPKLLNKKDGYGRVGTLYNDSIYDNLQSEYKTYGGDIRNYKISPKKVNTIIKAIEKTKNDILEDIWVNKWVVAFSKYLNNYVKIANDKLKTIYSNHSVKLKTILNENVEEIKKAHEMKSYYTLAKTLNGFDLNNSDESWTQCEEEVISEIDVPDDEYEHIYIEIDWQSGCPPDKLQLEMVAKSFEEHKIKLHIDAGEYSVNYEEESYSNVIRYPKQYTINSEGLEKIVKDNFSFREKFRYCMYVWKIHRKDGRELLGCSDSIYGRMFQVGKQGINDSIKKNFNESNYYFNYDLEASIFMHELGHTLGLCHGGDEKVNFKPNYMSTMNYLYANTGLIGRRKLNYSEYEFDEVRDFNHFNEIKGIDKYNTAKEFIGINWALNHKENKEKYKVYSCYYDTSENRSMNFNMNDELEEDANVDFYIEYEVQNSITGIIDIIKQNLFYNLGFFRNCKKSINDWDIVYKNINPPNIINYSAIWN